MNIQLTKYSHGAGCGCKISPAILDKILHSPGLPKIDPHLLVGNDTRDDAAVYDLGNGQALISTTDFFMPIVDDAFDFGRIASANAISDVYAMGGKPILATAILGWPVDKLPIELAQKVLDGAKIICNEAGIPLAGGHSIDTLEPMFGLSVNGLVDIKNLKQNSTAKNGDLIYITKKIGVGILATALKRNILKEQHNEVLTNHLTEMAEGAELSAELNYSAVAVIDGLQEYISKTIVPDNTYRNWNSFDKKVSGIGTESFFTLCDPQTNGGLMVTVSATHQKEFEQFLTEHQLYDFAKPIGKMVSKTDITVIIK